MLTKEKSNQKRKCVNNQNNSASYFRLCNTVLHHHKKLIFVNLWSENGQQLTIFQYPIEETTGGQETIRRYGHKEEKSKQRN